jgi:O-antigen/teichoic acid export membrane protein
MILMFGVWINGLACVPYYLLQARNRPDVAAKLHAIETVPFLVTLLLGTHFFGLIGAAVSWSLRMLIDAILLFHVTGQIRNLLKLSTGAAFILMGMFVPIHSLDLVQISIAVILVILTIFWSVAIWPRMLFLVRSRVSRLSFRGAL